MFKRTVLGPLFWLSCWVSWLAWDCVVVSKLRISVWRHILFLPFLDDLVAWANFDPRVRPTPSSIPVHITFLDFGRFFTSIFVAFLSSGVYLFGHTNLCMCKSRLSKISFFLSFSNSKIYPRQLQGRSPDIAVFDELFQTFSLNWRKN